MIIFIFYFACRLSWKTGSDEQQETTEDGNGAEAETDGPEGNAFDEAHEPIDRQIADDSTDANG